MLGKTIYWYEYWPKKKSKKQVGNNAVFGETMENVRKHRDIKLESTEKRRNYLVAEPIIILKYFSQKMY